MMRFPEYLKRFTYTPNEFYDHLIKLENAASGDAKISIIPAEEVEASDMDGHEQVVTVQVVNDDGDVLDFYHGTLTGLASYLNWERVYENKNVRIVQFKHKLP